MKNPILVFVFLAVLFSSTAFASLTLKPNPQVIGTQNIIETNMPINLITQASGCISNPSGTTNLKTTLTIYDQTNSKFVEDSNILYNDFSCQHFWPAGTTPPNVKTATFTWTPAHAGTYLVTANYYYQGGWGTGGYTPFAGALEQQTITVADAPVIIGDGIDWKQIALYGGIVVLAYIAYNVLSGGRRK